MNEGSREMSQLIFPAAFFGLPFFLFRQKTPASSIEPGAAQRAGGR